MTQRFICFVYVTFMFLFLFLAPSYGAGGPSDKEVKEMIKKAGTGLGYYIKDCRLGMNYGEAIRFDNIKVKRRGNFNKNGSYWPVRVELTGLCKYQGSGVLAPDLEGQTRNFYDVLEFLFIKNDYGKWKLDGSDIKSVKSEESPAPPPPVEHSEEPAVAPSQKKARNELKQKGIPFNVPEFADRIQKGDIATLKLFLNAGIENHPDLNGEGLAKPLMLASAFGQKNIVQTFLSNINDVNFKDNKDGTTALIAAGFSMDPDIFRILLKKGADPNIADNYGNTSLNIVAGLGSGKFKVDIECWAEDITDGQIGGWKSKYPDCQLDDGGGDINASYKGEFSMKIDKFISNLNLEMKDFSSLYRPANTLAIGFKVNIKGGLFEDLNTHKIVEMKRFSRFPELEDVAQEIRILGNVNRKGATEKDFLEVINILLEKGADVNAANNDGWSPLMHAVDKGEINAVKLLIAKVANVNALLKDNRTPLIIAAENGYPEIVSSLIEKGANINEVDNNGRSALIAAAENGHAGVVTVLIDKGFNVNTNNSKGWSALMSAASHGHTNVVKALIEQGADVNAKNIKGWTALMSAAEHGHTEVVKVLLAKGADVDAKTGRDWTALMSAVEKGQAEAVKALLEEGADIGIKNISGTSAFHLAHAGSNMDVVNAVDARRKLSEDLIKAAGEGNIEAINVLLDKRVNINVRDQDGRSALVAASMNGHKEAVKMLLDKGAKDIAVALFFAEDRVHDDIATLLKEVKSAEVAKRHAKLLEKPIEQVKIEDAVNLLKTLRTDLNDINAQIENTIQIIMAEYKNRVDDIRNNIAPKDEFETSGEYQQRVALAQEKVDQMDSTYSGKKELVRNRFSQEINEIEEDIEVLMDVESEVPEGGISIEFQTYSADEKKWPLVVHWKSPDGDYSVEGYLNIEGKDAKRMKENEKALKFRGRVKIEPESYRIKLSWVDIVDEAEGKEVRKVNFIDGVVTIEGLQWAQDAGGKDMSWDEAHSYVQELKIGGYSDWRLPTKGELESLLSYCKGISTKKGGCAEYFNKIGFKNVQSTYYWSSTNNASGANYAWIGYMTDGRMHTDYKRFDYCVWPVRSMQ